jgi:hypothetical protein
VNRAGAHRSVRGPAAGRTPAGTAGGRRAALTARSFTLGGSHEVRTGGQSRGMSDSVPGGELSLGRYARPKGKPSSLAFVAVIIAGFMGGGIAIIVQSWWLFWLSVAVILLGLPASWLVRVIRETAVAEEQLVDRLPGDRPAAFDRASATGPWQNAA